MNELRIVYYYFDNQGHRRPIDFRIGNSIDSLINQSTIDFIKSAFPETNNNLFVLIDGIEFKLA